MEVLLSSASRGLDPPEGLGLLLLKLGHTRPLTEPRRRKASLGTPVPRTPTCITHQLVLKN